VFFVFSDFVIFACAPTDTSNVRRGIPPRPDPKKNMQIQIQKIGKAERPSAIVGETVIHFYGEVRTVAFLAKFCGQWAAYLDGDRGDFFYLTDLVWTGETFVSRVLAKERHQAFRLVCLEVPDASGTID
jgi:hypothetical protein